MIGEARHQGGPEVAVRLRREPEFGALNPASFVELQCEGERLRGRFEPRDRPLEEELVTHGVLDAELDEAMSHVVKRLGFDTFGAGEKLGVAVGEHRVVDGVLRREVGVQRRRLHAECSGDVPQAHRGEPVLTCERPGRVDDLPPCRLPPPIPDGNS